MGNNNNNIMGNNNNNNTMGNNNNNNNTMGNYYPDKLCAALTYAVSMLLNVFIATPTLSRYHVVTSVV